MKITGIGGGFFSRRFSAVNSYYNFPLQTGAIADTYTPWMAAFASPGVTIGGRWLRIVLRKGTPLPTGIMSIQVGLETGGVTTDWLPGSGQSFRLAEDNFFVGEPYILSFPFFVPPGYDLRMRMSFNQAAVATIAADIFIFN